jgi:GxGYxYP putative glycoside hydrolase C-terminal domain/GxGYxY sequence motif in domain of unknown function N-terminal
MSAMKRAVCSLPAVLIAMLTLAVDAPGAGRGGINWPDGRALPRFAEPTRLDVVDLPGLSGDQKLLLGTLQGVVNRTRPRIYLIGDDAAGGEGRLTWLRSLRVPYKVHPGPWRLMSTYRKAVRGTVVFDPELPDTVNVATTLAGIKDAVVASPALAERLEEEYGLPVLDDLRGRFADRLEAYEWQFEELWPQTTHRMLIGLPPQRHVGVPPGIPDHYTTVAEVGEHVHDASNSATYDFDLSDSLGDDGLWVRFDDAFTDDGWGPAIGQVTVRADDQVIAQFAPGTAEEEPYLFDAGDSQIAGGPPQHRFADGDAYFVYRFAPPAGTQELTLSVQMWNEYTLSVTDTEPERPRQEEFAYLRDYAVANRAMAFWLDPNVAAERALFERIMAETEAPTPYLGWFPQDVAGEFGGTELASRHGVYVLAADWFENLSVHSGSRAPVSDRQAQPPSPPLENRVYVTFVVSEGDNLQYNEHRLRVLWGDPGRGSVPITWTTSPLLADAAPNFLSHYQRTATRSDLLVAGPSGAGYIYPSPWPDGAFDTFTAQTRRYMDDTGMDIVYVLNRIDGLDVDLAPEEATAYVEEVGPQGILLNWGPTTQTRVLDGNVPLSTVRGAGGREEIEHAIAEASAGWDGESPLFLAIGVLAWNTTPTDLAAVADALGPEYRVVRGDQYFELIRGTPRLSASVSPRRKRIGPRTKRVGFGLRAANVGAGPSGRVTLCVRAPRNRVKVAGPRCRAYGSFAPGAARTKRFRLKVKPKARGRQTKITFTARGPSVDSHRATATLIARR